MERRTFVIAAAALTAGCSADEQPSTAPSTSGSAVSDRVILGPASSVPVGAGTVFSVEGVVVTQPEADTFVAFDVRCPHRGCVVSEVSTSGILCPCHDSLFSITDGAPLSGPATAPLGRRTVSRDGDNLILQ